MLYHSMDLLMRFRPQHFRRIVLLAQRSGVAYFIKEAARFLSDWTQDQLRKLYRDAHNENPDDKHKGNNYDPVGEEKETDVDASHTDLNYHAGDLQAESIRNAPPPANPPLEASTETAVAVVPAADDVATTPAAKMSDKNASGGAAGGIFGSNTTTVESRQAGKYTRHFKRVFEIQFNNSTTHDDVDLLPKTLKARGKSELNWFRIPLQSAVPQSIMPRQWEAIMQDSRRVRIKSIHVRCYGWSPWITSTTQNLTQIQTTPNTYFYYVVDHPRILPGYNVEASYFSIGKSDLFGGQSLRKHKFGGEPYVRYGSFASTSSKFTSTWDQMSLDLFNHPNFATLKQDEEINIGWTNTAEDEWFHCGMPWSTNFDNLYLLDESTNITADQDIVNAYSTKLFDPNISWGGNPSFCPSTQKKSKNWVDGRPPNYRNDTDGEDGYYSNGIPAGPFGITNIVSTPYDLACMTWSKDMMTLLPKSKKPPPFILVRSKSLPEASAKVSWNGLMELSCEIEVIPNVMGYLPLNLGDAYVGWCGDNMFGMRTPANGMGTGAALLKRTTNAPFTSSSAQGNSYKAAFRHKGLYEVNTENFPKSWGRSDSLVYNVEAYRQDLDDESYVVGIRDPDLNRSFENLDLNFDEMDDNVALSVPQKRVRFN